MKTGVSYFGNRMPRHFIERDLPELLDAHCTFVLHTFSEHDLSFYSSSVREMVAASREAGLEVYLDPWGVAGVFGGEAYSNFLLQHPDAWQMRADGARIPLACPNSPALAAFMQHWTEEAAALAPDILFWDEPHFTPETPGAGPLACRCDVCRELYYKQHGGPMPTVDTPEVAAFRQQSIVRFIDTLCRMGATHGLRNAVCLLPFEDDRHGTAHWEQIAALPNVDILGVTPFWHLRGHEVHSYVRHWSARVVDLCRMHGKEPQAWLQAFLIDAGREQELYRAAEVAYQVGIRNLAAWGFRGCEHMTALRPDQPEAVWQAVRESFRTLRARP